MIHKRQGNRFFMPDSWWDKIDAGICPVCDKPNKRQFRCCSPECTEKFWNHKEVYWSNDLKEMCFKRDNYVCQDCGANNKKVLEFKERFEKWKRQFDGLPYDQRPWGFIGGKFKQSIYAYEDETKDLLPESVLFECDHIVPIALGGDEYDLKNLQTLCQKCHKKKTASEAKDFARARKNQLTLLESIQDGSQKKLGEIN